MARYAAMTTNRRRTTGKPQTTSYGVGSSPGGGYHDGDTWRVLSVSVTCGVCRLELVSGQGTWCLLTVGSDLVDHAISGGLDVGGVEVFVDHHPGGAAVSELVATENPGHSLEGGQIVEMFA